MTTCQVVPGPEITVLARRANCTNPHFLAHGWPDCNHTRELSLYNRPWAAVIWSREHVFGGFGIVGCSTTLHARRRVEGATFLHVIIKTNLTA